MSTQILTARHPQDSLEIIKSPTIGQLKFASPQDDLARIIPIRTIVAIRG